MMFEKTHLNEPRSWMLSVDTTPLAFAFWAQKVRGTSRPLLLVASDNRALIH
jgi:hypothetical protein